MLSSQGASRFGTAGEEFYPEVADSRLETVT